ncbi:perforin-1-like [Alosa pseudoharengus]|uniref:perforin-1-like n=1 Tax=Alosa pseudoharengus TaxID=34774 RepID=UPI003F8BD0BA
MPFPLPLLLILSHLGVIHTCRTGTLQECHDAPFVPGHNLAGEGFDVVMMQHKGAYVLDLQTYLTPSNTCTLCENPHQGDQLQKLPLSVLDWRPNTNCKQELTSASLSSVTNVAESATSVINNDWSIGLELGDIGDVNVGGSHSNTVEYAMVQSRIDKSAFTSHELSCTHYSYRVPNFPPLSPEFLTHVQSLPAQYTTLTQHLYSRFVDTYGTHYIRQVELGGRLTRLTSIRSCLATVNGHSSSQAKDCISTGLSIGLGYVEPSMTTSKCSSLLQNSNSQIESELSYLNHVTEVVGGDGWFGEVSLSKNDSAEFRSWLQSLKEIPDIVSYSLFPLHELVADLTVRRNVKNAVRLYLRNNALPKEQPSEQCTGQPNLSPECCPLSPMKGKLSVTIHNAWGMGSGLDPIGPPDPYAKLFYGHIHYQTHHVQDNANPHWNAYYNLGHVAATHGLRIEVWDKDLQHDDHLGRCTVFLHEGSHTHSCGLDKGGGFSFSYTLTCDKYLTGYQCSQYKASQVETTEEGK